MGFEEDLDLLTEIIVRTRNKNLKKAFKNFIASFNASMKDYVAMLATIKELDSKLSNMNNMMQSSQWDVDIRHG